MEECPPGGDCTSGDYDPSKTDNPPVLWTSNRAGEQAQGESMSKGDDGSQPASHSPELKRKKVSSTTSASQVLKKHEDEFFDVIIPKQNLLWLKRKEVISEGLISRIEAADTRDAKEILFEHLRRNADVSALRKYCKMARAADGFPRMQKLGEKMLNELTLEGLPSVSMPQSVSAEGSQIVSTMGASTVSTSGMAMAVNPSPDVSALSLESCKMDIVSCDVNVFESQKHPADVIRSLYFNAYNHLIRILSTHCSAIKSVALGAVRTKQVSATEVEVEEACDLCALFECLEVDKKWNDLYFLDIAILSLPVEASKEKAAAQLVLNQYKSYLTQYVKAVSIKEGKRALSFLQRKQGGGERMVVSKITDDKEIDAYTCHDLLELWKLFLIETLEIPEDHIEYRLARVGNSATPEGPMTEWHRAALLTLQGSLKLNVKMIRLSDMLERPAGGFMDRAEVLRVKAKTGNTEQMGELINILLGKEDMAFNTFCDLLERSNYEVWARELKSAAERLKTVGAPNEGGQTARRISVSKPTAPGHDLRKFERQYSKAVETSASVTLQITKCTTIGPPRIGKSCFKNLLIGEKWDEKEGTASTDIMEAPEWVECYSVEKEGSEQLWQLLPPEQQHGGLLKAINKLASSSAQPTATGMTFGLHKEMTDGEHEESTDEPHEEMTDGPPNPEPTEPSSTTLAGTEPSTAKGPATIWQALKALSCAYNREELERLLKDEEGKVLGETRLIHFIDTGGQAIYHDVHPVLITSPSVYLVVFSLLDFFQQKSKADQIEYFRSELIQRPLRSIYTFGTKKTEEKDHLELQPQVPKIFIVGTYLDKIPPGEVCKDFLTSLHEMISSEIGTKPYRQFVQYDVHGRAFWAVDNTLAGKTQDYEVRQYVSTLRTMVQDKSMEMSVRVPLPWMLLKMVMDGKGERYCRYSDLLKEAHDRGYVKEKEDLDTMLRLFHILGLLYHKVPEGYKKEDSLVFLNPDSLYSATSYFLMAAKEEIQGSRGGTRANDPQTQPAEDEICHAAADARQQEPDPKIVQRKGVIRRMEDNIESIRHAMERELKKVDDVMTKLDLEPAATTEEVLRGLHAQLEDIGRGYMSARKITKDASTLQDKRQMFIGRLVHSLASAVASVLPNSGAEGHLRHIRKEIEKTMKSIRARYESRSIRSNDMDQFLSILQELRIIAKLSDSDAYIVPAALPDLSQPLEFDGSADPILVTVVSQAMMRVCYLPSGLFCCLISELVTALGWTMIPQGRTHVVFQPGEELTGRVHMTEHESYIEIKMESESPLQKLSKTCQEVREQIHKCMTHVFNTLYSGSTSTAGSKCKESVVWGFQCQAHPYVKSHIAVFQEDEFECCATCLIQSSCVQEVEPEELAWFTSELDLD